MQPIKWPTVQFLIESYSQKLNMYQKKLNMYHDFIYFKNIWKILERKTAKQNLTSKT